MNASERHALARIAATRPDQNFTYTAAELHAFITAVREEAQADEAERLYLATEAADLAPVTDEDRRAAREGNWWQRLHSSEKGIAERERGWDRGDLNAED